MITIKSAKQVEKMRASAKVTKGALELLEKHIKPGVTTAQRDKFAYDFIISQIILLQLIFRKTSVKTRSRKYDFTNIYYRISKAVFPKLR